MLDQRDAQKRAIALVTVVSSLVPGDNEFEAAALMSGLIEGLDVDDVTQVLIAQTAMSAAVMAKLAVAYDLSPARYLEVLGLGLELSQSRILPRS